MFGGDINGLASMHVGNVDCVKSFEIVASVLLILSSSVSDAADDSFHSEN